MTAAISSDLLARLVADGRKRGRLTVEDLAQVLPIDSMAPGEIALVVAHLEEAGVPVEVDEALLQGRPASGAARPAPGGFTLPEEPRRDGPRATSPQQLGGAPTGPSVSRAESRAVGWSQWRMPVLLAAVVFAIVLVWTLIRWVGV